MASQRPRWWPHEARTPRWCTVRRPCVTDELGRDTGNRITRRWHGSLVGSVRSVRNPLEAGFDGTAELHMAIPAVPETHTGAPSGVTSIAESVAVIVATATEINIDLEGPLMLVRRDLPGRPTRATGMPPVLLATTFS